MKGIVWTVLMKRLPCLSMNTNKQIRLGKNERRARRRAVSINPPKADGFRGLNFTFIVRFFCDSLACYGLLTALIAS